MDKRKDSINLLKEISEKFKKNFKREKEIEKIPEWERTDKDKKDLQKIEENKRMIRKTFEDIHKIINEK